MKKVYQIRAYDTSDKDNVYNLEKFFDNPIKDGNVEIWTPGADGTIKVVEKTMGRSNVLLSFESRKGGGSQRKVQANIQSSLL